MSFFFLFQIIYRTTLDHPYHCLYVILALSNASKDNLYPTAGHVTGVLRNPGGRGGGRLQRKPSAVGGSVDEVNHVHTYTTVTLLELSFFFITVTRGKISTVNLISPGTVDRVLNEIVNGHQ